jgi:hypothetical protein
VALACADLGFFAPFLRDLGFCNPDSDRFLATGGSDLSVWSGPTPPAAPTLTPAVDEDAVTVALSGASLSVAEAPLGLLLLDADGAPIAASYAARTSVTIDGDVATAVRLSVPAAERADAATAVLMYGPYRLASVSITP